MNGTVLISRYRKLRRTFSWPQLIQKMLSKMGEKVFVVHRASLREWETPPADADADNPIFLATCEDIDEAYDDLWTTREQAIALLRQGHQLMLWKENGQIIFYQWLRRGSVDLPHLGLYGIKLPARVAYAATAYVPLNQRGRLLLKRAQRYMEARSTEVGAGNLFALIDQKDPVVNRYHERILKTQQYQNVTFVRLLFLKLYRVENAEGTQRSWFVNSKSLWNKYSKLMNDLAINNLAAIEQADVVLDPAQLESVPRTAGAHGAS